MDVAMDVCRQAGRPYGGSAGAALPGDGSVVTWGDARLMVTAVQRRISSYKNVQPIHASAGLLDS